MPKNKINKFPTDYVSGSKRTHLRPSEYIDDWWVGYGKDKSCQFEGTWWDMICFARNVLGSKNTKQCAPEFYLESPEICKHNYTGEDIPYEFVLEES